jgi:hypothetical protein
MFRLNVLQNQWLMLALIGGLAMVLGLVLACMAFWRARRDETPSPQAGGGAANVPKPSRGSVPWVLIVAFVAMAAWAVIYVVRAAAYPPNW